MTSVRIFIRRLNELDLRIKEVPEGDCRFEVEAQSTGDNHIHIALTLHERGMTTDAKGDVDNPVNDAASEEVIAEGDGDVVRVGDAFSHFGALQSGVQQYFNEGEQSVYPPLGESSAASSKRTRKAEAQA